jgi:ABC-type antimicrobial peptide transport system permease subunit
VIGAAAGAALAVATSRVLATMLFGLKSTDALTYAAVVAIVVPTVLLAAVLPAARAARIDPLAALRND